MEPILVSRKVKPLQYQMTKGKTALAEKVVSSLISLLQAQSQFQFISDAVLPSLLQNTPQSICIIFTYNYWYGENEDHFLKMNGS